MTGRDLILYILANHLEDEDIFAGGKFVGLYTVSEYASIMDVGPETVRVWAMTGMVESIIIYGTLFIPATALPQDGRNE